MLQNFLIFLAVITGIILLFRFYKSLKIEKPKKKDECDFKISNPRFCAIEDKQIARFIISSIDKHAFFVNFPIMFRFYSDIRFKSKVKIKYKAARKDKLEKIVDKTVIFETKTIECKRMIDDIIVGAIYIEIAIQPEYGYPIIEFEILHNDYCCLDKSYKKIIKFPKIN